MSLESLLISYHSRFSPPVGITDPFGQKTSGRPTASPANALKASQDNHWIGEGLDLLKGELKASRLEGAFGSGKMTAGQTRRLLLRLVASGRQELGAITQAFVGSLTTGLASLGGWFKKMLGSIIPRHFAATIGLLGTPDLAPLDRDSLRGRVNTQIGYLEGFKEAVRTGQQILDGRAVARAQQYANAAYGTAQGVRRDESIRDGFAFERRILGEVLRHCRSCPELASRGWVPIGTLPAIGETPCGPLCHCHFTFSTEAQDDGGPKAQIVIPETPKPKPVAVPKPPAKASPLAGIKFVKSENAASNKDVVVQASVAKLERDLAKDVGFHVGVSGAGGIAGRYEEFRRFLGKNLAIEMPRMTMGGGEASFVDGRHRFAVLRDLGLKTIPVTVAKEEAAAFRRKYGAKRR
jgi:hypothetical protein